MENKASRRPPSIIFLILLAISLSSVFYTDVFQLSYYYMNETTLTSENPTGFLMDNKYYFVKTKGCRIPAMDPFDLSVLPHLTNTSKPKCNKGKPILVDSDLESIFLVKESFKEYRIHDESLLECCYRKFKRVEPKGKSKDNNVRYDKNCKKFINSAVVDDEYIKVTCTYNGKYIYKDYFAFVPIKVDDTPKIMPKDPLNVLVIGIDSVSRLNLIRQMPKTYSYLKEELGSVDLEGYNKIGDNTFPNVMAILTGMNQSQLKECWPNKFSRFDNCSFIWKDYKENGFTTVYAENSAGIGIFNYGKKGFIEAPTDYFWSSFNWEAEHVIGNEFIVSGYKCVGPRMVYQTLINYIDKFTTRMHSIKHPYFAFFWEVSVSHDYIDTPKWADGIYHSLFRNLTISGRLNNTVLFFISDHGMRWGPIRLTYQGRVEERLPFVHIVLPPTYRRDNPRLFANLMKNKNRLTTPYDMHETLKDLLHPHTLTDVFLNEREINHRGTISRGYSLFNEVPESRTCEDAAISPHWCTCQESFEVSVNDTKVVKAAVFAVEYMNGLLVGYADCEKLLLDEVLNAQKQVHNRKLFTNHDVDDYLVMLRTTPGDGVFEVTVRMQKGKKQVMGTISRINLYGKQSACIMDFHLKLYCYCKGFVEE